MSNTWSTSYCFLTDKPFRALLVSTFTVSMQFTFFSATKPSAGVASASRLLELAGELRELPLLCFFPPCYIEQINVGYHFFGGLTSFSRGGCHRLWYCDVRFHRKRSPAYQLHIQRHAQTLTTSYHHMYLSLHACTHMIRRKHTQYSGCLAWLDALQSDLFHTTHSAIELHLHTFLAVAIQSFRCRQ